MIVFSVDKPLGNDGAAACALRASERIDILMLLATALTSALPTWVGPVEKGCLVAMGSSNAAFLVLNAKSIRGYDDNTGRCRPEQKSHMMTIHEKTMAVD